MTDYREIKDHYDCLATTYDARWSAYNKVQIDWVMAHWPHAEKVTSVLDVGCGTGLMMERVHQEYPDMRLVGVDASSAMLKIARSRGLQADFYEADIETFKLPLLSDIVLSLSVMHHLNDIDSHIRLLHGLVKENGTVFLSDFSLDGWGMKFAHRHVWLKEKTYRTSFPQWLLMKKLAEKNLFSIKSSAILKPNWFWRVQIYELKRARS